MRHQSESTFLLKITTQAFEKATHTLNNSCYQLIEMAGMTLLEWL